MRAFDRRELLLGGSAGAGLALSGCAGVPALPGLQDAAVPAPAPARQPVVRSALSGPTVAKPSYTEVYGAYPGEQFPTEAFDYASVDPTYLRQTVMYNGGEAPGTIVVDPHARQLFLVEPGRRATRYGVGVGREGFAWSGNAQINMRRAWPDWIPPHEMIERDPTVRAQLVATSRGLGVPGGPRSPLGARAMYLFGDHRDLGYRIHGTTEPETIGTNVSSGCIRMVNQDVIHLYGRAAQGTSVVVMA